MRRLSGWLHSEGAIVVEDPDPAPPRGEFRRRIGPESDLVDAEFVFDDGSVPGDEDAVSRSLGHGSAEATSPAAVSDDGPGSYIP